MPKEILSSTVWTLCYLFVMLFFYLVSLYHLCFGFLCYFNMDEVPLPTAPPSPPVGIEIMFSFWDKLHIRVDLIDAALLLDRGLCTQRGGQMIVTFFGPSTKKIITRRQKCWCHIKYWYWIAAMLLKPQSMKREYVVRTGRMWSDIILGMEWGGEGGKSVVVADGGCAISYLFIMSRYLSGVSERSKYSVVKAIL